MEPGAVSATFASASAFSLRSFSGLDGLWVFNPEGLCEENMPNGYGEDLLPYNQLVQYYADHIASFTLNRWPDESVNSVIQSVPV